MTASALNFSADMRLGSTPLGRGVREGLGGVLSGAREAPQLCVWPVADDDSAPLRPRPGITKRVPSDGWVTIIVQ